MSMKIISIALVLIMCLALVPMTALAADTPSSWAVESVNKAIAAGLVPASLQSKYDAPTTRAEFCALAVALYENVKGTITGRATFTDTSDVNVEKAASVGVVSGIGNNKFAPNDTLTREQAATMLARLADAVGKPFDKQAATFNDNGDISSWALVGVGQCQANGVMGGTGGNMFTPKGPYTREQSIITIMRTFDKVKGGGTIDKSLIGEWSYEDITSSEHHNYFFYENGTSSLFITGNTNYHGEASYSTSDGKIHLTEYYYINAIGEKTLRIDKVVEYSLGRDEHGEYLTIGNIPGYTEYGENRPNMKFRRVT